MPKLSAPGAERGKRGMNMRAMMSVCGTYNDEHDGYRIDTIGPRLADAALAEARAILRESEPGSPDTASFCIERLQGSGRVDGQGRTVAFAGCVALAETLAAFVALELPE